MKKHINLNLNQLALPFGQTRSDVLSYENRAKAFWALSFVCLACLVIYIYAVNATARNVSLRASLEREANDLNTEIASLEFQYIARTNNITPEIARQYGFVETAEPLYVSKGEDSSLSFNTQNR